MPFIFGTFFTISASNTEEVVTTARNLITDLMPIFLIVVGVAVGLYVLWGIVSSIKK